MSIVCPGRSCHEDLDITIKELATHHDEISETLFDTIIVTDTVLRIILLSFHVLKRTQFRVSELVFFQ